MGIQQLFPALQFLTSLGKSGSNHGYSPSVPLTAVFIWRRLLMFWLKPFTVLLISPLLASLIVGNQRAIAQDSSRPSVVPEAARTGNPAAPLALTLQELQQRIDTAWGLSRSEVKKLFADKLVLANYEKVRCIARRLYDCEISALTLYRGFQSSNDFYNVKLNLDDDRLTSAVISLEGSRASRDFGRLKTRLQAAYGPGTAKYPSPEGAGAALWEWRLPTTTISLNYLGSFGGSTELVYYPTSVTSP